MNPLKQLIRFVLEAFLRRHASLNLANYSLLKDDLNQAVEDIFNQLLKRKDYE